MTIDEAIEQQKLIAENNRKRSKEIFDEATTFKLLAENHEQLAEWLKELKDYRDKNKMVVRIDVENVDSTKDKINELSKYAENQYSKAIDDFVENISLEISESLI